ncbi:hypothetical protein ACHAQA_007209 [Verticillium albo-atrum]
MSLANLRRSLLMTRVPTTAAVIRGANVNIILKADQPTGRTVSGSVQDVLTRGNHPRGIKVRLSDGRVGRVQSMAGAGQASQPTQPLATQTTAPLDTASWAPEATARGPPRQRGRHERQEEPEIASQPIGLDAYIRPAKTKRGKARGGPSLQQTDDLAPSTGSGFAPSPGIAPTKTEVVACPVCGEFEGDAAAVEHHVASHFDS